MTAHRSHSPTWRARLAAFLRRTAERLDPAGPWVQWHPPDPVALSRARQRIETIRTEIRQQQERTFNTDHTNPPKP